MAKTADNARVYDVAVMVAPKGTVAPTDPTTAWGTGWEDCGWLSEDGLTETKNSDTTELKGLGGIVLRRVRTSDGRTFKFQCLEETALVLALSRPGSTATTTTGVTHTSVKAFTGSDERAFGFDLTDGSVHTRKIVPIGEAALSADVVAKTDDFTVYEFTVTAYPDADQVLYEEYSDNPALAVS